jgi:hypothetical protein
MLTDSNAVAKLYSIASQCYLTGGPAVFQARSLYWIAVNDHSMTFYDECVNGSLDQFEMDKTAPPSDTIFTDTIPIAKVDDGYFFKLYPNLIHVNGTFVVQTSEEGNITFYNELGQLVYQSKIIAGTTHFTCDDLKCESNIIMYKATLKNGNTENGKIVIVR